MSLCNTLAQFRAYQKGVVHTTLNPEGPGAVRIHLVPPRWQWAGKAPYVVILNGQYVLPLGYSWAVLLGQFIAQVNHYAGQPMDERQMEQVVADTVAATRKIYPGMAKETLAADLGELLGTLFDVAQGRECKSDMAPLSLRQYAPHMQAPHRMDLMVSAMTNPQGQWQCNLKCRHCYAAGQAQADRPQLDTDQWKQIIDSCQKAGVTQLTFTGGEPTLRQDLPQLVEHAKWFVTRLNTNGILLTEGLCRQLKAASLDSVQITLYSQDAAIHDQLVGVPGSWEKTVAGLGQALAAGLDTSVNTPLCRQNADYAATLAFLQQRGIRYASCSGLIETGNAAGGKAQLSPDELGDILGIAAAFCAQAGMELSFTSPGRVPEEFLREQGLGVPMCGAGLSNMAVAPDGTVVPCQSWLAGEGLGNLLRQPWQTIWNHPLCQRLRNLGEEQALHCPLSGEGGEHHEQ